MFFLLAAMTAATADPAPPPGVVTATVNLAPEVLLANSDPSPAIVQMLQRDEGLRLKLYRDHDRVWSVGYGRNMTARGISEAEALYLLQNDIRACQGDLDAHLAWWRLLNAPRQAAMVSLCYNLGIFGLKDFKGALAAMETGKYRDAARLFLHSKWARQVGHRAQRITDLIYPPNPHPGPSPPSGSWGRRRGGDRR
jgi:lysozyme